MKHTKGPWKFKGQGDEDCWIDDHLGQSVASTYAGDVSMEECVSNARLIAAAPEMLEALRMLNNNLKHRVGDCYSNDYMGLCVCGKEVAESIIAKAEGRDK